MSNKTLTAQRVLKYTDEDGVAQSKSVSATVSYKAMLEGELDVPATTAGSVAFAIPFGSIAKASAVYVKNNTDQELTVKINGSAALENLPVGGEDLITMPALPAAGALTAYSLTTTTTETLDGTIAFKVFGDPV